MGTIYQFLPFDNVIITFDMTGAQLKTILEEAVMDSGKGIQVSGLKFTYDPDQPSLSRVVSISLSDGTPIDMNDHTKTYKIATNDFLAGGTTASPKDGFSFASQSSNMVDTHAVFRDILTNAIKAAGSQGIGAGVEKRIQSTKSLRTGSISILVNNQELKTDVEPFIQADRVMVPLGSICQALGAAVEWNPEEQSITIVQEQTMLKLIIGNRSAVKNGETVTLDAVPQIVNNRTLVPLSFVSESLRFPVHWDADKGQIIIN